MYMRKSAIFFVSYIVSLLLCFHFGAVFALAAALIPLVIAIFKKDLRILMLSCALAILGGVILMSVAVPDKAVIDFYDGKSKYLCGTVKEITTENTYIKLDESGLTVNCSLDCKNIGVGDKIKGVFVFSQIKDTDEFPSRLYNAGKGAFISAKVYVKEVDKNFSLAKLSEKIRDSIGGVFKKYLGEFSGLASGIMLGEKTYIPYKYKELLYANGITHILCVSGLHFGILLSIFASLFASSPLPKTVSCVCTALLALFYMFITGFTVSILRAGIMSLFVLFDYAFRRRTDSLSTLSFAAFAICLVNPLTVLDLSFRLSFLSTAGIILMTKNVVIPIYKKMPKNAMSSISFTVVGGLAISLAAVAMCMPVIAVYFGKISVMTPIGNLVCAPIAELFLLFAFFLVVISPLKLPAVMLAGFVKFLGKAFVTVCELLSGSAFYIPLDKGFFVYISVLLISLPIFASLFGTDRRKEITLFSVLSVILLAVLA